MARKPHSSLSAARLQQILPEVQLPAHLQEVHSCASFDLAGPGDLCFVRSIAQLDQVHPLALCLCPNFEGLDHSAAMAVQDVEHSLTTIMQAWDPWYCPWVKVHESAQIHPTAVVQGWVGQGAVIGPYCVVSEGSFVGDFVELESHVFVAPRVHIGTGSKILAGASLGSQGFGFGAEILNPGQHLPHLGGVEIGQHCWIGNQSNIAAGRFYPTQLGDHCKIDALVQIGHNCILGTSCYMAGQSGLAGSVRLGDGVLVGGGASISGHLHIGSKTQIAGRAVVLKNVPEGQRYGGFPAREHSKWLRGLAKLYKGL